jgi:hypothetical protein
MPVWIGPQIQDVSRTMTTEHVDAAIERITRRDATVGRFAGLVASYLMMGEGTVVLSQARVQQWLWWYTARKLDPDDRQPARHSAGVLFDELGLVRYAAIARDPHTVELIDLWSTNPKQAAFQADHATKASGVDAPDIDGFHWGQVMGLNESLARDDVERALETAIVNQRFSPAGKDWKQTARDVCREVLDQPSDRTLPGQSAHSMIITERVDTWTRSGPSPQLRQWRERHARHLVSPPTVDIHTATGVLAPVLWFLAACRDGSPCCRRCIYPPPWCASSLNGFRVMILNHLHVPKPTFTG